MRKNEKILGHALAEYAHGYQKVMEDSINGRTVDENLHLAFISIIAKNSDCLHSIGHLLIPCPIESVYYSIAGAIRGCLMNGIIGLYLANQIESGKLDNDQFLIRTEIEVIYTDQLKRLWSDLKYLKQNTNGMTDELVINFLNDNYGHYLVNKLNNIDDKPNFKHPQKAKSTKYYVDNSRKPELSLRFLDGFMYYSKIDHLGILTYKFYSNVYENKAAELDRLTLHAYDIAQINELFSTFLNLSEDNRQKIKSITKVLKSKLEITSDNKE